MAARIGTVNSELSGEAPNLAFPDIWFEHTLTNTYFINLKTLSMKRVTQMVANEYEKPQLTMVLLEVEQGFAQSSQLDDMKETEGEWAAY